jgi:hypothetical protein
MSKTIQSTPKALVESVTKNLPAAAQGDFRNLMHTVVDNLTAQAPGGNLLQIGGAKTGSSAAPEGVTHSVTGANGTYTVAISNPASAKSAPIWHRVSYAPQVSFTKDVTTMEPTTSTSVNIPAPGANQCFKLESSYDKKTWSKPQLASTQPISAGLMSSSAIEPGATFNQTNYAEVKSPSTGTGEEITISGSAGLLSSYTAVKGSVQTVRPSATIINADAGTDQYVGWDGGQYQTKSTLAGVLADKLEPVGKVTVGSGATGGGTSTGGNGGRMTAV